MTQETFGDWKSYRHGTYRLTKALYGMYIECVISSAPYPAIPAHFRPISSTPGVVPGPEQGRGLKSFYICTFVEQFRESYHG